MEMATENLLGSEKDAVDNLRRLIYEHDENYQDKPASRIYLGHKEYGILIKATRYGFSHLAFGKSDTEKSVHFMGIRIFNVREINHLAIY